MLIFSLVQYIFSTCFDKVTLMGNVIYPLCLQIDAHVGGVNDLAFAYPNKQLCVVTCGDDKLIKVNFILS